MSSTTGFASAGLASGGSSHVALLDLAEQRMAWTEQRQSVLAQNIANADTPGWKSKDLAPFAAHLAAAGAAMPANELAQTNPMHMAGSGGDAAHPATRLSERAPDGNAVSLDQELTRIAETETAHDLAGDLYRKYLGLFRTAIGR